MIRLIHKKIMKKRIVHTYELPSYQLLGALAASLASPYLGSSSLGSSGA